MMFCLYRFVKFQPPGVRIVFLMKLISIYARRRLSFLFGMPQK